jgi:hypothetical protein
MAYHPLAFWNGIAQICRAMHKRCLAADGGTFPDAHHGWFTGTVLDVDAPDLDGTATIQLLPSSHDWGDAGRGGYGSANAWYNWPGQGPAFYRLVILLADQTSLDTIDPKDVVNLSITGTTADGVETGAVYKAIMQGQITDPDDLIGKPFVIISDNTTGGIGEYHSERWPERPRAETKFLGIIGRAGNEFIVTFTDDLDPSLFTATGTSNITTFVTATSSPANSVILTINGTSDVFTVAYNGDESDPIDFDASASEIADAINAITTIGIGGGSASVTGPTQVIQVTRKLTVIPETMEVTQVHFTWTEDQWAGYDAMMRDTDGITRRLGIVGNSTDGKFEFTDVDWQARVEDDPSDGQPGDPWPRTNAVHIIEAGGFWRDSAEWRASVYYRTGGAAMLAETTRDPFTGAAGLTNFPVLSIDVTTWSSVPDIHSEVESVPALFNDVWQHEIDFGIDAELNGIGKNDCDKCYTPNAAKFVGGIQAYMERRSTFFVDPSYSGGVNAPITYPSYTDAFIAAGLDPDDGWTAKLPCRVRFLFDKTRWQRSFGGPDAPAEDIEAGPHGDDPAPQEQTGSWVTRPKSTRFAEYSMDGRLADMFTPDSDGDDAIIADKLFRFTGNNAPDPFYDADQWDILQYFVGEPGINQHPRPGRPARAGSVDQAGAQWIIDNGKDWIPAELVTHSGIADGGNSTSLAFDSTFAASSFNTHTDRGRWAGTCPHWIEVNDESSSEGEWIARPITSHTSGAGIGFPNIGFSVDGKQWRIVEPNGDLNLWQLRWCTFKDLAGVEQDPVEIAYSHKRMLWFVEELPFTVEPGWTYRITDNSLKQNYVTGGVYWKKDDIIQKPIGADSRTDSAWGPCNAIDFPDDERFINPDYLTRYRKMIIGDYFGEWLDAEMKEMLGVMLDTMKGYDFKSRGEDNQTGGGSGPQHRTYNAVGSPTYQDAWDYMTAAADSFWPIITSSTDGDPFLAKTVTVSDNTSGGGNVQGAVDDLETLRKRAYPHITGFATLLIPSSVDFYAKGVISTDDPDEGVSTDWPHRVEAHFDPQGISLVFREYALIAFLDFDTTSDRFGSSVGSADADLPVYTKPPDPLGHSIPATPEYADIRTVSGFSIADKVAVLHWEFDDPWL